MNITPLPGRVLVKLDPMDETFADGGFIVRPDIAKEKPMNGTAVAVGAGCHEVDQGDRVSIPWATGTDLFIGGAFHVAIKERDILMVIG